MKLSNKILKRSCKTATFDQPNHNLWLCNEMISFMLAKQAVGLAANQIGRDLRLFVMSVDGRTRHCFNPEILSSSPEHWVMSEGCLSFSETQCIIQRPKEVRVRYQDHRGQWIQDQLDGLESRSFQHELDHLNGITMLDRQKEQHAE